MRKPSTPALPRMSARQLSMSFESARVRSMSPTERGTALSRLAVLLLEAADVAVREDGDDER